MKIAVKESQNFVVDQPGFDVRLEAPPFCLQFFHVSRLCFLAPILPFFATGVGLMIEFS
jgi:hypothetical protein